MYNYKCFNILFSVQCSKEKSINNKSLINLKKKLFCLCSIFWSERSLWKQNLKIVEVISFSLAISWNLLLSKIFNSYIPLAAHWLNENYDCKHRVWNCREMEGEHTDKNICKYIQDMPSYWNITFDHVHVFMRDNAKNTKEHKQHKSIASSSRYGYKVELNISYARETEKAKIRCPVLCG